MKYKLVIFDYDGTLADTFRFHEKTIGKIVRDCGSSVSEEEMSALIGTTIRYIFEQTLPVRKHKLAERRLKEFYNKISSDYWETMSIIDHAEDTLRELRKKGIKTALVTNSHKILIEKSLKNFHLRDYFDWIEAADEDSYCKEERIQRVLKKAGAAPQDALYVGDTSGDMEDARNTGMDGCLILNDISWIHKEKDKTRPVVPDYTISDIKGVLHIIL